MSIGGVELSQQEGLVIATGGGVVLRQENMDALRSRGTVVLAGGRQAERRFTVTVTAAQNRQRDDHGALLGSLLYPLLRGVPARIGGEDRVLHPLHLKTEGDKLCFTLCLCAAIPPEEGSGTDAEPMQTLPFEEEN